MHLAESPDIWPGMKARNVINQTFFTMFFAESTEVPEANIKIKCNYSGLPLWKRGIKGDFINSTFFKSPLAPFAKGGIIGLSSYDKISKPYIGYAVRHAIGKLRPLVGELDLLEMRKSMRINIRLFCVLVEDRLKI